MRRLFWFASVREFVCWCWDVTRVHVTPYVSGNTKTRTKLCVCMWTCYVCVRVVWVFSMSKISHSMVFETECFNNFIISSQMKSPRINILAGSVSACLSFGSRESWRYDWAILGCTNWVKSTPVHHWYFILSTPEGWKVKLVLVFYYNSIHI